MPKNIIMKNARIMFRNFSGAETKFNHKGDRNFCLIVPTQEMAETLLEEGWNVRRLEPREDGDEPTYYIQVTVSFEHLPPKIVIVRKDGSKSLVPENMVDEFDYADFNTIDVSVRPYEWEVNGNHGIKGYLKTMYVTFEVDEFEDDYPEPDMTPFDE